MNWTEHKRDRPLHDSLAVYEEGNVQPRRFIVHAAVRTRPGNPLTAAQKRC